ncbi:MAG TPA: PrsW family intramembrane metalloprotease [Anaerolineales bacterium]|nr:PrsW family intramembrane metalloprotease [Anaerolineales bacterium]
MSAITIISFGIATIIPIIALYIIYTRDLYSTGAFKFVLSCFIWGGIAFALASLINRTLMGSFGVDRLVVVRTIAPIEEEILKGLILLFLVRRKEFTYFVDGAIYGFAIGIGFAIFENYEYLYYASESSQLSIAVIRVISTNLMHATGSAIIGIALGYGRFSRRSGVLMYILGGAAFSMAIHIGFNNIASAELDNSLLLLIFIVVIGTFGFGLIFFFIRRGTQEAQTWIRETLGMGDRVTAGEVKAVDQMKDIDALLAPLAHIYGEDKAHQIEKLLRMQARLGILRKNLEKLQDQKLVQNTKEEIADLREEMDIIRKEIGQYEMMTLRLIFPEDDDSMWNQLESILEQKIVQASGPKDGGLWDQLGSKVVPPPTSGEGE